MSIFKKKEKEAKVPSISLTKKINFDFELYSIDWTQNIHLDNPIDKEKVNCISQAMKIARKIFFALEKVEASYREEYRWDDSIFFNMAAKNIFAATIYYYCKNYPKEYCNLAYITATICSPDMGILIGMLKQDRETEIFIRNLDDCLIKEIGSQYLGIKGSLEVYLGRLYTKEFFYLFDHEEYKIDIPQYILINHFDNIINQVEKMKDNNFHFSVLTKSTNDLDDLLVLVEEERPLFDIQF